MRADFLAGLADLADRDPRVVLITADLGFGSIEAFADRHPTRFLNLGVTEQAIVGVATGLAEGGFIPYCYSIAAFSVARTFEFLRNGPVAHRLPVRIIGMGAGLDYSYDGLTHFAVEDLALVCSQPEAVVLAPTDAQHAREIGSLGSDHRGLVYYRLVRTVPDCPLPHVAAADLAGPCLVIGFGDCSRVVSRLLAELGATGIGARGAMASIIDRPSIAELADRIVAGHVRVLVTAESHYVRGGFGTLLADELMEQGWKGTLVKWGVESLPVGPLGSLTSVENRYCTPNSRIVQKVSAAIATVNQ